MSQPQQPFQPDASHAVSAQQEEIARLRASESFLADRVVYLSACLLQVREEANTEIARLHSEISMLRGELASRAQPTPDDAEPDAQE